MKDRLKIWLSSKVFWWNFLLFLLFCWLVLVRLLLFGSEMAVHYHADFRIYIDGEPLLLESDSFYEEISVCGTAYRDNPSSRIHLHDKINHVIHVHDHGATYGHLMANLGFSLGDSVLQARDKVYAAGEGGRLRFILNGRPALTIANQIVRSTDILLIDFSDDSQADLLSRYEAIPQGATEANAKQDPASCAGSGESNSFWTQFKDALGF